MNLYIRFFNDETIVNNLDDAVDFLTRVTNGQVDSQIYDQLSDYINSTMPYPRRFKVRTRTYFIVIKTPANTMEEFKARGQQMQQSSQQQGEYMSGHSEVHSDAVQQEPSILAVHEHGDDSRSKLPYDAYRPGWYEAEIQFKRVLFNEIKGKNEYIDTVFAARVKAHSVKECYDLVCNHLMSREDVDKRSQMPSIKGRNFNCRFLGMKSEG